MHALVRTNLHVVHEAWVMINTDKYDEIMVRSDAHRVGAQESDSVSAVSS